LKQRLVSQMKSSEGMSRDIAPKKPTSTKREMTEEHKAKIAAGRAKLQEAKQHASDGVLTVGGYKVYWFDEYNFCVEKVSNGEQHWYPDFEAAVAGVLDKEISDRCRKTCTDILGSIRSVRSDIMKALERMQASGKV
jgi:hypothetical protein